MIKINKRYMGLKKIPIKKIKIIKDDESNGNNNFPKISENHNMTQNRFQSKRVNNKYSNINLSNNNKRGIIPPPRRRKKGILFYVIFGLITTCLLIGIGGILTIRVLYLKDLPDISIIEKTEIKQASTIYDRNNKVLYTLYGDEKRTSVPYEKISNHMINAIVSGEDKNFFENPGVDIKGIGRAGINYLLGKTGFVQGTSTISQQLIKNLVLTNERKIERKIKEIYLSYQMTKKYSKEKILELYLNTISFGNNAYGIEQASISYFGKKASKLNVLDSAILASLPKGPSQYSPYSHYDRLMGYLYIYNKGDKEHKIKLINDKTLGEHKDLVKNFKEYLSSLNGSEIKDSEGKGNDSIIVCNLKKEYHKKQGINIDRKGCTNLKAGDISNLINSVRISNGDEFIEYEAGRKDYFLRRMLEDGKEGISNFDQYKRNFVKSIGFKFNEYRENIKYPHFVMYIKEYLEKKYGKDVIENGGLKIYTSLDSDLQNKAEEIVEKQVAINRTRFDANNAALISIDNKNGDILAFVGGADYYNKDIDGNVNMITSKRQPGSSFKPYVYALAIDKYPIGNKTPVFDVATNFGGNYKPKNYDGRFSGKTNIEKALNQSKNIPAIKMFYYAGEQAGIIEYLKRVGVKSLNEKFYYGPPMALGTGEMTLLEMVQGYSIFANLGKKITINPILKILDSNNIVVEEKIYDKIVGKRILDKNTAYIIANILSDVESKIATRRPYLLLNNGRKAGVKTGTSNKIQIIRGVKILLPGDLWTAGFTPQVTTVVWVGNTNGKGMRHDADGLNGAAPIWRDYMNFYHANKEKLTWKQPESLKPQRISKTSGLLAPEGIGEGATELGLFKNIPPRDVLREVTIDSSCNGKVGINTPENAKRKYYISKFSGIDSGKTNWQMVKTGEVNPALGEYDGIQNSVANFVNRECSIEEINKTQGSITIDSDIYNGDIFINGFNYQVIKYTSNNPLEKIQIFLNDSLLKEFYTDNNKQGEISGFNIPSGYEGDYKLTIRAIDENNMSKDFIKNIYIEVGTENAPEISVTNPNSLSAKIYSDQSLNLRWRVDDRTSLRSTNVYINDQLVSNITVGRSFVYPINKGGNLEPGNYKIKIEATNKAYKKSDTTIDLEILKR